MLYHSKNLTKRYNFYFIPNSNFIPNPNSIPNLTKFNRQQNNDIFGKVQMDNMQIKFEDANESSIMQKLFTYYIFMKGWAFTFLYCIL